MLLIVSLFLDLLPPRPHPPPPPPAPVEDWELVVEAADLPHPVLRFSPAHAAQLPMYAPAFAPTDCMVC